MSRKQELLQLAQNKVREGGYNNFSFRELAKDIGIKSASVHYHFPTKADLGAELAKLYTDNFINALGDPKIHKDSGKNPVAIYVEQFRQALHQDKKMCLCGLLGAESDVLPEQVRGEIKRFFKKNLAWLEQAYLCVKTTDAVSAKQLAIKTISVLEGAMMISIAIKDNSVFDQAIVDLM
ncbi:TetR/AcrR family transcriptional regulator [Colwellia sp. RE-S-Sl-9]